MTTALRWPSKLWLVRHGQSTGNVARDNANASHLLTIDIPERELDVPLSDVGRAQARALGRWFASMTPGSKPTVMLVSPYRRARDTGQLLQDEGALDTDARVRVDERLREREFGALDRLTRRGIEQRFPEESERRSRLGKFYYRPPGGESWCDVILRLRSLVATIRQDYGDGDARVLVVAHQVIVQCFRYLVEELTEDAILAIDRQGDIANCGVTEYSFESGEHPKLVAYNFVAPLEHEGAPVTAEPAQRGEPK